MSKLFVVGTPLGNLSDMSPRAISTLKEVDFIAAEDTRVTLKLLNKFEIDTPMISYYEHNIRQRGEIIIDRIKNGENCAIVTDAGMPCISDPGEDLVRLCVEHGIETVVVPSATAVTSALALSGLSTQRFSFEGFLSTNKKNRNEHLDEIKNMHQTLIFYEAPHKLISTLNDMFDVFGDRNIAIARELTKLYEQVLRFKLSEAIAYFEQHKPRGEFVLIIEGKNKEENKITIDIDLAVDMAKEKVAQGVSKTVAAKEIAAKTGFRKSEIYSKLID